MSAAIFGTKRQAANTALTSLGRLERDARTEALEKAKNKATTMLGGGGLGQNPSRRVAPLEGLGR